jgi:hypothetical protein
MTYDTYLNENELYHSCELMDRACRIITGKHGIPPNPKGRQEIGAHIAMMMRTRGMSDEQIVNAAVVSFL